MIQENTAVIKLHQEKLLHNIFIAKKTSAQF